MSLPTHLAAELDAWDRGDLDGDRERRMDFLAALVQHGDIPGRVEAEMREAIDDGFMTAQGDRLSAADWSDDYEGQDGRIDRVVRSQDGRPG